jgi:large subunit ribosomal protein L18
MKANYRIQFRRRREGTTDYRQRLKLLKSGLPRVVVRSSLKNFSVQFISFDPKGDKVLASATSKELEQYGWGKPKSNTPSTYLTGFLAGKSAASKGIKEGILDIGLQTPSPGSKVFAAMRGVLDAGIKIPYQGGVIPKAERIEGKHLGKDIPLMFNEVKVKIGEVKWKQKK